MSAKLILSMLLAGCVLAPVAYGKKTRTTGPASTQSSSKDVEEQKDRAKAFENGKNLGKDKTAGKVDRIVGDVNDLDRIIKEREAAEQPAGKRKKGKATTQPTTQPATQPVRAKSDK